MQGLMLRCGRSSQAFSTGIFTDEDTLVGMEAWLHTVPVYCPYCGKSHLCELESRAASDEAERRDPEQGSGLRRPPTASGAA